MGKYTVGIMTYIVIEADDIDSAYNESEDIRVAVAETTLADHELEDQVIDVEIAAVYEIEETEDE